MSDDQPKRSFFAALRGYIFAGVLTAIPIWATWLIFSFLVQLLKDLGTPPIARLAEILRPVLPAVSNVLVDPRWGEGLQSAIAVVLVLLGLFLLGWFTSRVIGQRVVEAFDNIMNRIPIVELIYSPMKKFLATVGQRPEGVQRVVLIDFPSPEMKTVGLVTRTLVDQDTGRKLVAVYVPTTPNPTSGYLEIVPLDKVTSTNWTLDEAMGFVVTGGAVAPATMNYDISANAHDAPPAPPPDDSPEDEQP
jgi:uncharacterized membrane protein